MTSKISFFKLMKEDFKRRSWLIALISLICLFCYPVFLLMHVDSMMGDVERGYLEIAAVARSYHDYLCIGNVIFGILVIGIAIVTGVSGYYYLHSRTKLDFYHSLPITRLKFFFVQYVSGILIFLIPYIVSILLCLLVGAVHGMLTGEIVLTAAKMLCFRILQYLAAYGTAILATVMTGKILTALLGICVFAAYIPGVLAVNLGLKQVFFETFLHASKVEDCSALFSPIFSGIYAENVLAQNGHSSKWIVIGVGVTILWILVMTGLSIWLYQIRKTEAAEKSMAFSRVEGAIKVLLVVPLSLAAGIAVMAAVGNSIRWFFLGIIGSVMILPAVIEFIFHLNMKEIFKHKSHFVIAGALTMGVALFFYYDITGYDTWLPAKEDVAQMAVYQGEMNGDFCYRMSKNGNLTYGPEEALNAMLIDDFDEIYTLARKGAREKAEGDVCNISIAYRLKNGKREERNYDVSKEDLENAYKALFRQPEFLEKFYPIFDQSRRLGENVNVYGMCGEGAAALRGEKMQELLDIYREELKTITYEELLDHTIGEITFEVISQEEVGTYGVSTMSYTEGGYPICDRFTKTIAFLKDTAGIDLDLTYRLKTEDIQDIEITDFRDDVYDGLITSVTSEEEIREVLDRISYTPLYRLINEAEDISIQIILKNDTTLSGGFYFKPGMAPDFLERKQDSLSE